MFASVRHYKGITDPSQLGQLVQDDFVPILKQHQGFVAYYWVDSGDNEMVSMSVFEREERTRSPLTRKPRHGSSRTRSSSCPTRPKSTRARWSLPADALGIRAAPESHHGKL